MFGLLISWESYQQSFLYVLYCSYYACAAARSAGNCASGAAMVAQVCSLLKQENCSQTLPGENGITHRNSRVHSYRHGKLHAKLHVSIAQVSRDPAHPQAALLLTQLGLQEICTPQFLTAQHHPQTLQAPPRRTYRMPPMNGPREVCGCCIECEDCECSNGEICDCSCPHEIGESSSSPPPPPPLQPPPAQATSQPRSRPPKPQPRDMSPRRPRTRSRSRSPTPLVRTGRRYSREHSREGSVAEAARYVASRVWRQARRDRRDLEEKWVDQSRKTIAQFKIGHKEGIICAQRLHNSYVLPQNLSLTFITGFMACLVGVLIGLIIMIAMWNATESF